MPVIETLIDAHSPDFVRNREALLASLQQLHLLEQNLLSKALEAKPKFDNAGNCCRVNASTCCWTLARRSWTGQPGRLQTP